MWFGEQEPLSWRGFEPQSERLEEHFAKLIGDPPHPRVPSAPAFSCAFPVGRKVPGKRPDAANQQRRQRAVGQEPAGFALSPHVSGCPQPCRGVGLRPRGQT